MISKMLLFSNTLPYSQAYLSLSELKFYLEVELRESVKTEAYRKKDYLY